MKTSSLRRTPRSKSGKRNQKAHIAYGLVGFIPVDELIKGAVKKQKQSIAGETFFVSQRTIPPHIVIAYNYFASIASVRQMKRTAPWAEGATPEKDW